MEVMDWLYQWKHENNPSYTKDFKISEKSISDVDQLLIITILGNITIKGELHTINISRFFITHSYSNPEYKKGDILNLKRLTDSMEQMFFIKIDELINTIEI